jgi:hypothetical protein
MGLRMPVRLLLSEGSTELSRRKSERRSQPQALQYERIQIFPEKALRISAIEAAGELVSNWRSL